MDEKRKFPRYNVTISVYYTGDSDIDNGDFTSKNISKGGMCLSSIQPMEIGRIVSLAFVMISQTIYATGRIIWCEQINPHLFENGIEFTSITDEHLKEIDKYIKKQ